MLICDRSLKQGASLYPFYLTFCCI